VTPTAAKDAVTRWVIEVLEEAGWSDLDPMKVRDTIWK
jgi:hypothetical protein